ncbi:MAG TPA: NAD(P)-dependent oxidoreductase [Acidimicrobiales bacterium]|nr:NAD(P)-dependent oxidoreductase [Acidimicrobiales bacterium]
MVIGATGAVGTPLVRQLLEAGHEVIGTSRSEDRAKQLGLLGAHPLVLDALDVLAVRTSVAAAAPEAIVYQATGLAGVRILRSLDKPFAVTNKLRTDGIDNVLAAARGAGVRRIVAQSFAPYRYARQGNWVKTEDDPLDPTPPASARQTFAAMSYLDKVVTEARGIALRYGGLYGPGDEGFTRAVRKRQTPLVGDSHGMMSFVHLHDAAAAAVIALDHDGPAIYNIVDDEPAPMSEWLPALAKAIGAKPPRHFPTWIARLIAGPGLSMLTESRGASNTKAKRELAWQPRYPTWREGFISAYGEQSDARSRS